MSKFPEFKPEDRQSLPAQPEGPGSPGEIEEAPSLEGLVFSPYLTKNDLDGTSWNAAPTIPDIPPAVWNEPPMTEDAVLKFIASRQAALNNERTTQVEKAEPAPTAQEVPTATWHAPSLPEDAVQKFIASRNQAVKNERTTRAEQAEPAPAAGWLESPDSIREKLTPLGRPGIPAIRTGIYGNLADTSWLSLDRFAPIQVWQGSDPADTDPPASEDPHDAGPVGRVLNFDPRLPGESGTNRDSNRSADADPAPVTNAPSPQGGSVEEELPASLPPYFWLAESSEARIPEPAHSQPTPPATAGPELFQSWYKPEAQAPQPARIPNFGHLVLLLILGFVGLLGSSLLTRSAIYFHLWGVSTVQKAMTDIHYTIGSMAALYLLTFGMAAIVFPLLWHRGLFAGLQWNAGSAARRFWPLLGAAGVCFLLAMVDEVLLPGPTNAPIDKLFDNRTAAWILFAFGVTFAPFFEEAIFRGFLLPAFCTAIDWSVEKAMGTPPHPPGWNGHPGWSMPAMIFASFATSIPFALMHAEQTGYSIGPFLLLVAVSLVLCWARLGTRSLAASVLVHASYNFLLFSLMLLGTGGFRHLDKM